MSGVACPLSRWTLNIGALIQAAPQIFGQVMGELFGLLAAGVLGPGQPTSYGLAEGPKALAELEARATVGKRHRCPELTWVPIVRTRGPPAGT